jgi:Zn-dependent protease/predicted transcriptional regulator
MDKHQSGLTAQRQNGSGWRIARVAGIDIHLDLSLLVIFFLITFTLGTGLFPRWHPDWSPALSWATALAAAVLFFVSVLLHELSHALVARRHGIAVPRITLFIFGGMAQMENEPDSWRGEFWMAIVGPLASLLIGVLCALLATYLAGPASIDPNDVERTLARFDIAPTLLMWLGQINIVLALFNMLPGFPLDGGRVLRALLWGATGNVRLATRWAAGAGQLFAWILIASGVAMMLGLRVPLFGTGFVGGLWISFIGWFLYSAALASYRQLILKESLHDVPVTRLMQTALLSVTPELPVDRLVDEYVLHSDQRAFPVIRDGQMAGMVSLEDVRKIERGTWPAHVAGDIMTPLDALVRLGPQDDAQQAMDLLAKAGVNQVPVIEQGQLRGLIRREDVLKWLSLYANIDRKTAAAFSHGR